MNRTMVSNARRDLVVAAVALVFGAGCAPTRAKSVSDYDGQRYAEHALRGGVGHALLDLAATQFNAQCDSGNDGACSLLGVMYEVGHGVPRSPQHAVRLYRRACGGGSARGCANYAEAMLNGTAGAIDHSFAVSLLTTACRSPEAAGCGRLAHLTARGDGVRQSMKISLALLRRACEHGDPDACRNLGDALIPASNSPGRESLALYVQACLDGDEEACARLSTEEVAMPAPSPATVSFISR
jgi:TPR repeat protein